MTKIKVTKQNKCLDLKYITCFFGISINTAVWTVLEALLETHRAHLDKNKNKAFGLKKCAMIQTSEQKASKVPSQLNSAAGHQDGVETAVLI